MAANRKEARARFLEFIAGKGIDTAAAREIFAAHDDAASPAEASPRADVSPEEAQATPLYVRPRVDPSLQELSEASILLHGRNERKLLAASEALRGAGCRNLQVSTDLDRLFRNWEEGAPDIALLNEEHVQPSLVGLVRQIRELESPDRRAPIVVPDRDAGRYDPELSELNVNAYLPTDLTPSKIARRLAHTLNASTLRDIFQRDLEDLAKLAEERTKQLELARSEVLHRLALAAEYRDDATGEHPRRVGELAARLAVDMRLPGEFVAQIGQAAMLHDVGKIALPDAVLLKPGRLTPEEYSLLQSHTTVGAQILRSPANDVLSMARDIALTHHERWDGLGYPSGLKGEQIPLSGRIVAVADAFDALVTDRPYRTAMPIDAAVQLILQGKGTQFDPQIAESFFALSVRGGLPIR